VQGGRVSFFFFVVVVLGGVSGCGFWDLGCRVWVWDIQGLRFGV